MESIFIRLLNMSINASWLVLGIVAVRLIFKKAPKSIIVALWSTVALRLICPFSFESVLSLLPSAQTVPPDIVYSPTPSVSTGLPLFNSVVNPIITESFAPNPGDSANPLQIVTFIASAIWLIGVTAMLLYALVSYTKIRLKVREAAQLRDNVSLCDSIATPFILGIIKPQIYLPSDMAQEDMEYVIAHEKAHLKRHDNFWKPFGFLLLSIYWFNPVLWVAYVLLCRDIEFACDERVIRDMDTEHRKAYSYVLINCSAPVKAVTACPLAFGEVGVKGRIKSVLSYKKPAFWLIVAALLACVAISVAFLTNPKSTDAPRADDIGNLITLDRGSQLDGLSIEITSVELSEPSPFISVKWKNKSQHDIIFGEEFYIYYNTNGNNGYGGWEDCRNNKDFAWNLIGYYLSPLSNTTKKYGLNGLDMAQPGVYRFETSCSIEGKPNEDYKVWIEFELKAAVDGVSVHLLELTEQVFVSSMYSFVSSMSNVSNYRLVNGMNLQEIRTDGIIVDVGLLEEVTLNEDNFDSRFTESEFSWNDGYSLSMLKKNNNRMWQLQYNNNDSQGPDELFILLEQKDGSYYLGFGYYNFDFDNETNSDSSHIRELYRVAKKYAVNGAAVQTAFGNGSVFFYEAQTAERVIKKSYKSYAIMDNKQADKFFDTIEKQTWKAEESATREEYIFDGQIMYRNAWLYFGFAQKLFVFQEKACPMTAEIESELRALMETAQTFESVNVADTVYTYTNSVDPISPTVSLVDADKSFTFCFSGYSSYLAIGKYEYDGKKLILRTDDGKNTYVFRVKDDYAIVFDAKASSPIPEYRYFGGTMDTQSPVPDGAEFSKNFTIAENNTFNAVFDTAEFDIDSDGIMEKCSLSVGPTSGLFTFALTASENGELEYFNIFHIGGTFELSFHEGADGKMQLMALHTDETGTNKYLYDIGVDGENVYLAFDNGKKRVAYWGDQGVDSTYAPGNITG